MVIVLESNGRCVVHAYRKCIALEYRPVFGSASSHGGICLVKECIICFPPNEYKAVTVFLAKISHVID